MNLRIDTGMMKAHAATLEGFHRSAFPSAVRNTLNNTAYGLKKTIMPEEAAGEFEHRKPLFFKANSRVEGAKGFDIGGMAASVGFIPKGSDKSHAVEDLEEQEQGGSIADRAFIPLKEARTGKVWNKMVRSRNRLGNVMAKVVNAADNQKGNSKHNERMRFVLSALHAGKGGFLLGEKVNDKGNRLLYYINSIKSVGGNLKVNSTPLYAVKAHREVKVDATRFMRRASIKAANKMPQVFNEEVNKQLKKYKGS